MHIWRLYLRKGGVAWTHGIARREDGLRQRVKNVHDPIFRSSLGGEVPFLLPSFLLPSLPREVSHSQAGLFVKASALGSLSPCSSPEEQESVFCWSSSCSPGRELGPEWVETRPETDFGSPLPGAFGSRCAAAGSITKQRRQTGLNPSIPATLFPHLTSPTMFSPAPPPSPASHGSKKGAGVCPSSSHQIILAE